MTNLNYQKEQYRGTIKQLMKVRSIRKISIDNYFKWKNCNNITGVNSLKIDLQDGYVNIYGYASNGKCGEQIKDASEDIYKKAFEQVMEIFENEKKIPSKIKRNILVGISR